jgi:hypothetical protein
MVVVALLFAGAIYCIFFAPGVHVTVRNTGQEVLRNVTVHVTGDEKSLGDLAPGGFRSRKIRPASGSHVEVEFTIEQGTRLRLIVDCYSEPGYRGELDFEIQDGKIGKVKNTIRISIV